MPEVDQWVVFKDYDRFPAVVREHFPDLPPLTSEFMNIIKNSSVALTIGLLELTGRARAMQEFSFRVFEAFTAATVIYLLTNLVVVLAMRALEKSVRVPGLIAAGNAPQAGH